MSEADPWYLRDALARLRSGWRIRYRQLDKYREEWTIYGPYGDVGICDNAGSAQAYYELQCSLGPQQPPARVWPRDMLPFEDSVATEHRYEREVTDGVETADANYERPR